EQHGLPVAVGARTGGPGDRAARGDEFPGGAVVAARARRLRPAPPLLSRGTRRTRRWIERARTRDAGPGDNARCGPPVPLGKACIHRGTAAVLGSRRVRRAGAGRCGGAPRPPLAPVVLAPAARGEVARGCGPTRKLRFPATRSGT